MKDFRFNFGPDEIFEVKIRVTLLLRIFLENLFRAIFFLESPF
jgi:hypothetical protein